MDTSASKPQVHIAWRIVAYMIMVGFTILTIGPLLWLFYSSFKPHAEIVRNIFSLPKSVVTYKLSKDALAELADEDLPEAAYKKLRRMRDQEFSSKQDFLDTVAKRTGGDLTAAQEALLVKHAKRYFGNYVRAWTLGNLGIYSLNSVFFSVVGTLCSTFLALAAGYALAKFDYGLSKYIYASFLMGLLLTPHSILVPLFVMETKLGIDNTRLGVLLPYIAFRLPFLLFLATSFIKGLPGEIEEAAIIDGASHLGVFWHVIAPISRPVVATMLIFCFLSNWNEFVFVFVLTSKAALRTLPVGINAFAGGMTRDYGTQFAALVIGTLPMIVFYGLFHKRLAQGFASGALKG